MKCYIFFFILSFFSLFGYEHTVSIAAIFQNEAPYMKEWIEYHLAIGVDHFYLTNNRSEDDYLKVLKPYIDDGIVDLFHLDTAPTSQKEWIKVQQTAYLNTGVFARGKTKWMAFIDLDEFIFPVKHLNVKNFLEDYDRWPSICINWLEFGTSNIEKLDPHRLMIDQLIMRNNKGSFFVKNIVKLDCIKLNISAFNDVHIMPLKKGFYPISMDGKIVRDPCSSAAYAGDIIRIHHYALRDEAFFQNVKMNRPYVQFNENKKKRLLTKKLTCNQKYDNSISIIADKIREKVLR